MERGVQIIEAEVANPSIVRTNERTPIELNVASNLEVVVTFVQTRLPNLHVKSCEMCVYKWVASRLSRPKNMQKCRNLSQPLMAACIFSMKE